MQSIWSLTERVRREKSSPVGQRAWSLVPGEREATARSAYTGCFLAYIFSMEVVLLSPRSKMNQHARERRPSRPADQTPRLTPSYSVGGASSFVSIQVTAFFQDSECPASHHGHSTGFTVSLLFSIRRPFKTILCVVGNLTWLRPYPDKVYEVAAQHFWNLSLYHPGICESFTYRWDFHPEPRKINMTVSPSHVDGSALDESLQENAFCS